MGRKTLAGPATAYIAGELRAQRGRLRWGETGLTVEALVQVSAAMGIDVSALLRQAVAIAQESTDGR